MVASGADNGKLTDMQVVEMLTAGMESGLGAGLDRQISTEYMSIFLNVNWKNLIILSSFVGF